MLFDSAWRARLQPASFRGVEFKVDTAARASGRRIVLHEYPKRDDPYAEDMGRSGRRFSISCYVIGPDYTGDRDDLIDAFEQEGAGTLVHPTLGQQQMVVGPYNVSETRQHGGMATFEVQFIEAGTAPDSSPVEDTQGNVQAAAGDAQSKAASSGDARLSAGTTAAAPPASSPYDPGLMNV